jgi:hypothetical protein
MEHVELESEGDLTLEIGSDYATEKDSAGTKPTANSNEPNSKRQKVPKGYSVLVSRRHVSKASPVFRTMLAKPAWAEGASQVVRMPEDNPEAMLLLLRVAHLEFASIPTTIAQQTLYQLAVMCDKYDCVEMLQPWIKVWLKSNDLTSLERAGNAFICWTFGDEKAYEQVIKSLIRTTVFQIPSQVETQRSVALARMGGPPLGREMWPAGVLGEDQQPRLFIGASISNNFR